MHKLKLSRPAKRDLEIIKNYYEKISPEIFRKIRDRIKESFLLLQENPNVGHVTNDYDVFEWHIPRTPYTLPYMFTDDEVLILRVYDARQIDLDSWKAGEQ